MRNNELSLFNNFDLFDPFEDFFYPERELKRTNSVALKCDVIENEKDYEIIMDAPGLKKENILVDVENGYLTISLNKSENKEDNKKNYIRKERHNLTCKRSFYVGDIDESLVKASLTDGELHITLPKEEKKEITKKHIEIA